MPTSAAWTPRMARRAAGVALVTVALLAGRAAHAQAPPPRPDLLAALLRLGLSHEAGWEARRLTVENGPEAIAPETAYRVGLALALDGRPNEAAPFLTDAAAAVDDPRRADQWQLAAGVVLLRAKAFPHALHLFARVEEFGADEGTRALATRLRCVAQVLEADAVAAQACIAALPPASRPPPELSAQLLDTLRIDPHHRAIAGGVLSALLPGLGQATAGRPGDGAIALALNGGIGAAVVLLVADGAIGDAALVGLSFGLRYYLGNIQHGAASWRAAAEERRAEASRRLVRLLGQQSPR